MLDLPEPRIQKSRATERHRRVALSATAGAIAKGVSLLTAVISVPITLSYLGVERYGLWMTISSLALVLSFADMGLGNGLLNAIAGADGKEDKDEAHRNVSTAFFMLVALAFSLGVVFAFAYPWILWARVFNVSAPQAVGEAGPSIAAFVGCTVASVPMALVQRIQLGYQEGFSNSLWQIFGSGLGLLGLLVAVGIGAGLPWVVLAFAGGPLLATFAQNIVVFSGRYRHLRPRWSLASRAVAVQLAKSGFLFFVLQAAVVVAFASDAIVVTQLLGPESVAQYSVASRLLGLPAVLAGMILTPLWPAYAEAIARGDSSWVRTTLRRSLILALAGTSLFASLLVLGGADLIRWWAGSTVVPSLSLLIVLGLWTVVQATGSAVAMFLNGANVVRAQVVWATVMAAGALVLKIILTRTLGLPGVVWGTLLAYLVFTVVPYSLLVPRLLATLSTRRNHPSS
jgi:O-antigen/teichoic acid export membrane protein